MMNKLYLILIIAVLFITSTAVQAATSDNVLKIIETCQGLQEISEHLDWDYQLANDIDCSETIDWNEGKGFKPIGDSIVNAFEGSLDGNGHSIFSLHMKWTEKSNIGLFGYTDQAPIHDLTLQNVDIIGLNNVGAVAGWASGGDSAISNVFVSGKVKGSHDVGGLIGHSSYMAGISDSGFEGEVTGDGTNTGGLIGGTILTFIENSYFDGFVSGDENVGGLIGSSFNATKVSGSYVDGYVVGTDSVGGIVGLNFNKAVIENSYAKGNVGGVLEVGGIAGQNYNAFIKNSYSQSGVYGGDEVGGLVGKYMQSSSDNGAITNSYFASTVEGDSKVGGLIGNILNFNYIAISLENLYWDSDIASVDVSCTIFPSSDTTCSDYDNAKTTSEMQVLSTFEGWDFDEIWAIDDGNDYPYLQWEGLKVEEVKNIGPVDINGDGALNVVDVACMNRFVHYKMGGISEYPTCIDEAIDEAVLDLNCDSEYNVADLQIMLNWALKVELSLEIDLDQDNIVDACQE